MITLFKSGPHRNVMFNRLSPPGTVQGNQHLIVHGAQGILLDPGGHGVFPRLLAEVGSVMPLRELRFVFFSNQDPDVAASAGGWLVATEAEAFVSSLWARFVPHMNSSRLLAERIHSIPDKGMVLHLGEAHLKIVPAHFIYSPGNFQVYDPVSKILYTGDLGASLRAPYDQVEDFDDHVQYMQPFHKRYIPSNKALKMWANTVKSLEISMLAPQHGAVFPNRELVDRFIQWVEGLACGLDIMKESFPIPE